MFKFRILLSLVSAIAVCALSGVASAQGSSFYKNNDIKLIVGFNPGGGFDTYARTMARYWGAHIPGKPNFIVQNMPGAGSLKSAQHLYKIAKRDGSVLGAVNSSLASSLLLKPGKVRVDLLKFNWIGSPSRLTIVGVVRKNAPVQSLDDLKKKELIVAGAGSTTVMLPRAAQKILGLKFKVIAGYRGTKGSMLALERGEVQGATTAYSALTSGYADWLKTKKVKIFVQYGLTRHKDLPNVPMLINLAKTEKHRQAIRFLLAYQDMGRPLVAPPGVPKARLKVLRTSFDSLVKDKAFLAEAKKRGLAISTDYPKAEELEKSVRAIFETPPDVIDYVRSLKLRKKKRKRKKKKKN